MFSLRTRHYQEMFDFYCQLLGEPQTQKQGKWASFNLSSSPLVLWATSEIEPKPSATLELCLTVPDLDDAYTQLADRFRPEPIQTADHGREFFITDPDQNRIIIYQAFLKVDQAT